MPTFRADPMKVVWRLGAGLAAMTLVLAGCTGDTPGPSGTSGDGPGPKRRFAVITHGSAGDAFWDVVKKGAEQAGQDLGVTVSYQGSGKADEQANLINAAIGDKVTGIVVSMANPDALAEPIKRAVAQGVPVVT